MFTQFSTLHSVSDPRALLYLWFRPILLISVPSPWLLIQSNGSPLRSLVPYSPLRFAWAILRHSKLSSNTSSSMAKPSTSSDNNHTFIQAHIEVYETLKLVANWILSWRQRRPPRSSSVPKHEIFSTKDPSQHLQILTKIINSFWNNDFDLLKIER